MKTIYTLFLTSAIFMSSAVLASAQYQAYYPNYGSNTSYTYVDGCSQYQYNPYTRMTIYLGYVCQPTSYSYQYVTPYTYQYTNTYNTLPYDAYYYTNMTPYQTYQNYNNNYYYPNGGWYPSTNQNYNYNSQLNTGCYYQNGYVVCY
jgi:hypothetical protein